MSAETVTTKIEEKARAAAEAILAEAKEKAEAEHNAIIADANARVEKMLENAKQNADIAERGRAQADALNTKLGVLSVKRQMLDIAKSDAKEKLKKIDEAEFIKIFKKYISESELTGTFELLPAEMHRSFCKNSIPEFEKCGLKITLSDKNAAFDTGFMLSSENYDVEFSFDAILDTVFEKSEKEISDILFESGDVK
ncbi:MAG: hypothetical protein E7613_08235 [Ruminococcaceae bacterium]|nr:hypothetical protein [Oscillospiraceae bacterium]